MVDMIFTGFSVIFFYLYLDLLFSFPFLSLKRRGVEEKKKKLKKIKNKNNVSCLWYIWYIREK